MSDLTLRDFYEAQGKERGYILSAIADENTPVVFEQLVGHMEIQPPASYGWNAWDEYLEEINSWIALKLSARSLHESLTPED